jgi:hypothetical protein
MHELFEHERRKPGARGSLITLTDGQQWLLANPTYHPGAEGLTQPPVDEPLDRIFESAVLNENLALSDLWEVAGKLLKANYELSSEEVSHLIGLFTEPEGRAFARDVVGALFGSDRGEKTFTRWVRTSLIANGLSQAEIHAEDLMDVLAILVATNRTIPLSRFADACRQADERARLETLI